MREENSPRPDHPGGMRGIEAAPAGPRGWPPERAQFESYYPDRRPQAFVQGWGGPANRFRKSTSGQYSAASPCEKALRAPPRASDKIRCVRFLLLQVLLALLVCVTGSPVARAQNPLPDDLPPFEASLDPENFGLWMRHAWPSEQELEWEQIPWQPSFHEGVMEAARARKPLLLWMMNGHPLGST